MSRSQEVLQTSLFEEDYLLRELGQVAHAPQVALTELRMLGMRVRRESRSYSPPRSAGRLRSKTTGMA